MLSCSQHILLDSILYSQLVFSYPFISKTLRELGQDPHKVKHSCTMTLHTEGLGHADLDHLMKNPCDLEFIIGEYFFALMKYV